MSALTPAVTQKTPTPYRWEYHPLENFPVALIGPSGEDAMLATGTEESVYLRFSSQEMKAHILDALNLRAQLISLLEAFAAEDSQCDIAAFGQLKTAARALLSEVAANTPKP